MPLASSFLSTRERVSLAVAAMLTVLGLGAPTGAQIRIVSYNTATAFEPNGTPLPGLQNVLAGIGTASLNGVSKRIDILSLQEQNNATGSSTQQILNMMNAQYGAGTYAKSNLIADASISPFIDSPAVIYDQTRFTLVSEVKFGTVSGSGMPRQEIRYQFRPVGYGANADFYVYGVHYKANGDASSQNRRAIEAGVMRSNANTLPAGSRILYTGDFNLTEGTSEAAWAGITGPGTGPAGIDPKGGSWANANKTWSTQETSGLNSRLDFQFQTAPTVDGRGFSLIDGTYSVFGNPGNLGNGSVSPNANVRTASDHYPVVADYRYPARMGVNVASVPATVIVGANLPVNVTVSNTAPTQAATGADGLDYTVTAGGSLSGAGAGTMLMALSPGNNHALQVNTGTVGAKSGTVNVTSSSQEVANGSFSQNVSVNVIDHAQPGLSTGTIDFGIRARGLNGGSTSFFIYNTLGAGATAALDLDSVDGAGSTSKLTTTASPFANLPAAAGTSSRQTFFAQIDQSSNGSFSATYTFNLSDQDLLGEADFTRSLVLTGIIATAGDADLNNVINFDDYAKIDTGFNAQLSGWVNGDFDGNGLINFDDYGLIDASFLSQGRGGGFAGSVVPEPASIAFLAGLGVSAALRRNRRQLAVGSFSASRNRR